MKRFEIFFGIVKVPTDFLMTVLAFFAAYQLRLVTDPIEGITKAIDYTVLPTIKEYLLFSIGAATALVAIFIFGKMYSLKTTISFNQELKKSITLCGVWAMAIITYFFFTRTFPFSRLAILYSWGLTFLFIVSGRAIIKVIQNAFLRSGIGRRRLVFIGNNKITAEIYEEIKDNPSYKILGLIGNKAQNSKLKVLGSIKQLNYILKKRKVEEVIQTSAKHSEAEDEETLEYCELNHINYRFVPNLIEVKRTNIDVETIKGIPIISLKPTPLDGWGKVIKRIIDIIGAVLGFILLSPIFLITTIAIKLDSKGPIIFSRLDDGSPVKRVGQKGKLIKCYKFRSMQPKTDSLRYSKLAEENTRKDGPLVKIKNDPRVTRVGKFIRRYSIDELPQLWNILTGDMSLVGPRPHLPEEVANYEKHHHFVFTIKPGLTGIAQISGRSDLSFDDEVKLDRYYIENWSIWRDLKIILRTIFVVLKGHQD
jgi:exopolysaccharide biosynthesis polyprenyl glycosylphosphotransferase